MSKLDEETIVESKKPITPDSILTEGYLAIVFLKEGRGMTESEKNKYSHIVHLDVKTGVICYDPEQLKKSLMSTHSIETTTYESLRDDDESFSLWESKKLDLSSWVKQTLATLVPMENLQWFVKVNAKGLSLCRDYESVMDSILDFVKDCVENKRLVPLANVEVMEKLPLHEYIAQSKFPLLEGWIKENEDWIKEIGKHIDFEGFSNLLQCSQNLKSVIVGREKDEDNYCSICVEKLIKSSQAIQTPCSHAFHGSCILRWLGINSTCPLCRSELSKGFGQKKQEEEEVT